MIRVLIVDDHKLVREGYRALFDRAADIEVVGEARDGEEAVDMVSRYKPDLVTMDVQMPKMDGLKATRLIRAGNTFVKILMVAMTWDRAIMQQAIANGAQGFVSKNDGYSEFLAAVRTVADGNPYYSPTAARIMKDGEGA